MIKGNIIIGNSSYTAAGYNPNVYSVLGSTSSAAAAYILKPLSGSTQHEWQISSFGTDGAFHFYDGTAGLDRMIMNTSGYMGLSCTPVNMLDVNGGIAVGSYAGNNTTSSGNLIMSGSLAVGTATPNSSAVVTISSTTQGLLPPVMTSSQKNAISSPAQGLSVYDSTLNQLQYYDSGAYPTWCGFKSGYVTTPNLSNLSGFSSYTSNNLFWMRVGNFVTVSWSYSVTNNNGSSTMNFTCPLPISQSTYNSTVFSGCVQITGGFPNFNGKHPTAAVFGYDANNFAVYMWSGGYNNGATYNYTAAMNYVIT